MAWVLDYSGWEPSAANYQEMRRLGIVGVSRYLCFPNTPFNDDKLIKKAEYDLLRSMGFSVVLNWEQSAGSWRGGRAVGLSHGKEARRLARLLGHPDERPIIQSIDTAVTTAELPTAIAYQQAFNEGGGVGPQGVYGTSLVIDTMFRNGLVRVGWRAAAHAWFGNSAPTPNAAMDQFSGRASNALFPTLPANMFDANKTLKADWGQQPKPVVLPPPPPPPGPVPPFFPEFGLFGFKPWQQNKDVLVPFGDNLVDDVKYLQGVAYHRAGQRQAWVWGTYDGATIEAMENITTMYRAGLPVPNHQLDIEVISKACGPETWKIIDGLARS